MANVGTLTINGETGRIVGIAGTGDNAVVIELNAAERWNEFLLMSTGGAMDVDVSLDGTNFMPAIALIDHGSLTPATRVVVTAADRVYQLLGTFQTIRVRQNGAPAVAGAVMICSRAGRG